MRQELFKVLLIASTMILFWGCEQRTDVTQQISSDTNTAEAVPKVEEAPKEELIAIGEVHDGEALYQKNLQPACKMSGYALARKLSKEDWKEIAEKGKFGDTIESFCPELKFENIWTPDLYEYIQKYALSKAS